jgi:hypothetical protein
MRLEVHLHGYIELCEGVSRRQVENALRPLFDYLDVENMSEVRSLEEHQPGIAYHQRDFSVEICCTLDVGNSFFGALERSMTALGQLAEQGTAVEVILYHEDGRDETQLIFIGPTPDAIYDAQRRRMVEDVSALLRRQFNDAATNEVVALVNELFRRERNRPAVAKEENDEFANMQPPSNERHRLH